MISNLLVRIDLSRKDFSKGQRRIAAYIEEHYDEAAFMTAAKLGEVVGVSESTVVRFATQIGYEGYPYLQKAMKEMIRVTERRRRLQTAFNKKHGVVPHSVRRTLSEDGAIRFIAGDLDDRIASAGSSLPVDRARAIEELKAEMLEAANALEFERAALLRDQLKKLQSPPPS